MHPIDVHVEVLLVYRQEVFVQFAPGGALIHLILEALLNLILLVGAQRVALEDAVLHASSKDALRAFSLSASPHLISNLGLLAGSVLTAISGRGSIL